MIPIGLAVSEEKNLNIFPIGSYVKTMSANGGHLECMLGSSDIILEKDYLKTISPKLSPDRYSSFRGKRILNIFPIGSYVKYMSADGGHLGCTLGSSKIILKRDHLKTIPTKFGPN